MTPVSRCWWCGTDPLYVRYHDEEWGKPVTDDTRLFEKVCLEGFQAGLSWLTILRKREEFRRAFAGFDIDTVSRFTGRDVNRLLENAGIVRHRGKIESTINNARRAIELRDDGVALEHVDLGGGLGIAYEGRPMITPEEYAAAVLPDLRRAGIPVVLEPGRAIVGHSGALVAVVVDTKQYPDGRRFAVLDAGMTELLRPAMYGSFHRIVPLTPRPGAEVCWDVVGPICESSDVFARDRALPELQVDDLVAILDTGAYGAVMASNYNRRLLAPEVLVDDGAWRIIRRRQTIDDVLALET